MERPNSYDEQYISQQPALELLHRLDYKPLTPEQAESMRGGFYNVLLKTVLEDQLKEFNSYEYKGVTYKFSQNNIQQAMRILTSH